MTAPDREPPCVACEEVEELRAYRATPRWTAAEIERAGRHLGATARLVALAMVDVLRDPPKEWRR
jgi:hypothetical protein